MSELFDEESAAAIAQAAEAQTLAHLRRAEAVRKIVEDANAAVAAIKGQVADLVAGLGVPYQWNDTSLRLRLPDGSFGPSADLQGEAGPAGPAPTLVVGSVTSGSSPSFTFHADPNVAHQYILDIVTKAGESAWSPVLAAATDGARRVHRVVDWTGGTGSKPATGSYIGATGFVSAIGDGVDMRGASGVGDFFGAGSSSDGELMLFSGAGGKTAKRSNTVPTVFGLARLTDADGAAMRGALAAAPLASPALTGTPTAPTPANGSSSTQIATTAFVQALIAAIIGTAPANLDTLQEIAAQLANDESAVAGLTTTVAGKLAKGANLSDLGDAAAARGNLGLGAVALLSAINAANIADASANARTFLTSASYAAMTALLAAFVADNGSAAGTKGLVPAPAAGDAAAGKMLRADGTWAVPAAFPAGTRTVSATGTITAADRGKLLLVTAAAGDTITLTAAAAATLGAGFWCGIRRADGVLATVSVAAASGETINGLSAIAVYQESFTLHGTGASPLQTFGRQKVVPVGAMALTGQTLASSSITAAFGDTELAQIDANYDCTLSTNATLRATLSKGGSQLTTATYNHSYYYNNAGTGAAGGASGDTAAPLHNSTFSSGRGRIRFPFLSAALGSAQRVEMSWGSGAASAQGQFTETTATAISGFVLTPSTGSISAISVALEAHRS